MSLTLEITFVEFVSFVGNLFVSLVVNLEPPLTHLQVEKRMFQTLYTKVDFYNATFIEM